MPHFSATAERLAHEPWTVEIEGQIHTARPVSRPALLRFFGAVQAAKGDPVAEEAALRRLLRIAFPARWRYVLQPSRDPVDRIMGLGIAEREAALNSFFAALTPETAPGPSRTSGPSARPSSLVDATPSPDAGGVPLEA